MQSVVQQAQNTADEALDQINVEIETESSGPEYV